MSHQRYTPQHDAVKEPHSVSLKVLRLSPPSLGTQNPIPAPFSSSSPKGGHVPPIPASLAYNPESKTSNGNDDKTASQGPGSSNPFPFNLTPILNLPPSFGTAYTGETFSCTLCANYDVVTPPPQSTDSADPPPRKTIRDVRIVAEMKIPSLGANGPPLRLALLPASESEASSVYKGVDLDPDTNPTLQRIVNFNLQEEGNHVLVVTVSYYEATATSGRTRTFKKLYQFSCKSSLLVRTKFWGSSYGPIQRDIKPCGRTWILEAEVENCGGAVLQLEKAELVGRGGEEGGTGLRVVDCNWESQAMYLKEGKKGVKKPVLHPKMKHQLAFILEETAPGSAPEVDGKIVVGFLGVGWRTEMGHSGYLTTGVLSTRYLVRQPGEPEPDKDKVPVGGW